MAIYLIAIMTATPVYALEFNLNYEYSNPPSGNWGKPTSIEAVEVVETTETDNINRSKDSSFTPPVFGSYSADTKGTGELLTPNISEIAPMTIGVGGYSTGGLAIPNTNVNYVSSSPSTQGIVNLPDASISINYSNTTENRFTLPDDLYYSDDSIAKLKIPTLDLSVKVYETESLENLARGAGHFKSTSAWDGNVGICGHNRGVTNHFGKIHTLDVGDKIEYTTKLGTRIYKVVTVTKIDETDFTYLQRTSDNRITLITCVNNQSNKRWCVQAVEI